jgi:hypothetical protein
MDKPDAKRQLGEPRFGWEENIQMDLKQENGRSCIDLVHEGDVWRFLFNAVVKVQSP